MFRTCSSALAAVALLAGCAGASLGSPAPTPGGSPSAGPTATSGATTVASASPELVLGAKRTPPSGELTPGRYYTLQNAWTPVTFSFDIAEPGWIAQNGGQTISKNVDQSAREISWSVEIVDSLFATPCGANGRTPIGPAVEDLVNGLRALPDLDVSEPRPVRIDDRAGQLLELSPPAVLDVAACDPPIGVQVWLDAVDDKYLLISDEMVTRVYAIDLAGGRFILNVNISRTADPAEVAEFDAIVESITFHP